MQNSLSKKDQIKLSVIIVSYNCLDYLKNCLSSIDKHNDIGKQLEIIVVDNSNNLDTYNWLMTERPSIILKKNNNKGFGEANNVGSKLASGKYLLFLNPDTLLVEPIFKFAINKFENNPKLGCFGLQLIDENYKNNTSNNLRMLPLGFHYKILSWFICRLDLFLPKLMHPSGADLFVRKDIFFQCGSFDTDFFMYREEADLCNRINDLGLTISYFKNKKIIHLESKATKFTNTEKRDRLFNSFLTYSKKYNVNLYKKYKEEYLIRKLLNLLLIFSFNNKAKSQNKFRLECCMKAIKTLKEQI